MQFQTVTHRQNVADCTLENQTYLMPQIETITVSAGDVIPLLTDAALANRAWIEDFRDEPLQIPNDLYEVLLAYRHFRSDAA